VVIYPAPEGYTPSPEYEIAVNGKSVPVYDGRINKPDNCGFTYFDFEGKVNVTIKVKTGFSTVKIRPMSAGITPKVSGNSIEFDMSEPKKLSVEIDGKLDYPLFVFANPLEVNAPKQGNNNVLFFGPGIHHPGKIVLKSGQTVYVSGGAIVRGYFEAENAADIRIMGRGVMDAHENNSTMIRLVNCKNVLVEGIHIIDQPARNWTSSYWACDSVLVKNVKIVAGDDVSNDGIDIVSCHNFTVDDCFVKCTDDCVVVKAMKTNGRTVKDVKVVNSLFWNIQAFAIQIGPELDTHEVSDVLFKNCDLIHPAQIEHYPNDSYYYYCGAIGLVNGDDCNVNNIRYENIRIEDPTAKLISIKIMKTQWNRTDTYGTIKDIYFENVSVLDGKPAPSEIISYGIDKLYNGTTVKSGQLIENVTFENLNILGKNIGGVQDGNFIVCPAAKNLQFITTSK
jgi:polygalacturonase